MEGARLFPWFSGRFFTRQGQMLVHSRPSLAAILESGQMGPGVQCALCWRAKIRSAWIREARCNPPAYGSQRHERRNTPRAEKNKDAALPFNFAFIYAFFCCWCCLLMAAILFSFSLR